MKLVSDWRQTWRYYSTQAMALGAAVQLAWAEMPEDLRAAVPDNWVSYGTAALLALGVLGRLVKQADAP